MNFRKLNNFTGWAVCLVASLVYILTAEMRGSLWDCGEFVSACFKIQLPHPPGAPLFVLMGRFFIILFGDDPMTAARAVNVMNALASGFTILFLFWTITHFARKMMTGFNQEPTTAQAFTILGAGVVGGLAYTFSDSFWYSAVEGEVYALSSLFTALAFWAILKWERADDAAGNDLELRNRADRWIVFLFFSLGLSIGIHLLGLLVIPASVMVYYFKRYNYTRKGAIWAFLIGCLITGVVQVVVIKWTVSLAGRFDILFKNSFGLPFFFGFAFFFILIAVLVWLGLRYAQRKNYSYLRLGLWCFSFMLLGYSTYISTMERSNANPSMDMNNVDNPMSLVYYLGREQYGSQPILWGTHFLAQPTGIEDGKTRYVKGPENYVELAPEKEYTYDDKDYRLFPRVWDPSNEQRHADYYIDWLSLDRISANNLSIVTGVGDGVVQTQDQTGKTDSYQFDPDKFAPAPNVRDGQVLQQGMPVAVKIPTYADNIRWFMTYQMGFMYWRYFMWNFAGKQNDIQGGGNKRDGNWISGIPLIDDFRLGDQSMMPESIRTNKENNKLLLLPFILGIIGCIYQFFTNRKDWIVSFLLFFMTGIAVIVYLNQAGNQPRERDYAFASSFYAYAIWIGLAVVGIVRMALDRNEKKSTSQVFTYTAIVAFLVLLMSDANNVNFNSLLSAGLGAGLAAGVTALLVYGVRLISGKNNSIAMAGIAASVLCVLVPVWMAIQEWDDHDRSKKLLASDLARNYLSACPENAILFTFGDNDTYPLWYAQEVEGVRPDVRIVNTSLLGIDWYVNQLRYKVNESPAFDVIWSEDQIRGLGYLRNMGDRNNTTQNLYQFMKNTVGPQLNAEVKSDLRITFPSRLTIPVTANALRSAGDSAIMDSTAAEMVLEIPPAKTFFSLDQLTMLNILAANNWERPVCFTSRYDEMGLGNYLRQEGMIYRVVPTPVTTREDAMAIDKTKDLLLTTFQSGNAQIPGVYFDEENRRHLLSIRVTYAQAAINLADQGRKPEAVQLLNKAESLMYPGNMPYAMVSRDNFHNRLSLLYLEAAYRAGHTELVKKLKAALLKDFNDQIKYYEYLRDNRPLYYTGDLMGDEAFARESLQRIDQYEKMFNPAQPVTEVPGQ